MGEVLFEVSAANERQIVGEDHNLAAFNPLLPTALSQARVLQVRQTMNVGAEKGFQPTTNARNEAMLAEAGEFANHLKRCEKDIRALKQTTEGGSIAMPFGLNLSAA